MHNQLHHSPSAEEGRLGGRRPACIRTVLAFSVAVHIPADEVWVHDALAFPGWQNGLWSYACLYSSCFFWPCMHMPRYGLQTPGPFTVYKKYTHLGRLLLGQWFDGILPNNPIQQHSFNVAPTLWVHEWSHKATVLAVLNAKDGSALEPVPCCCSVMLKGTRLLENCRCKGYSSVAFDLPLPFFGEKAGFSWLKVQMLIVYFTPFSTLQAPCLRFALGGLCIIREAAKPKTATKYT